MALWLVLSALSDPEKHPDITTFITHHLWPKIVLESQNSVSLGIISNNNVKFNKESLYWADVEMFDRVLRESWPTVLLYYGMSLRWSQYDNIANILISTHQSPLPLYSPPSFHHQSKHRDFRNCIWIASINFLLSWIILTIIHIIDWKSFTYSGILCWNCSDCIIISPFLQLMLVAYW